MYDDIFNEIQMMELQEILRQNKKSLTTAESCTGGLIASMITEISGSSDVFNGSIVSYSNDIKKEILNVKSGNLDRFGAVSCEVVEDMLDGAIKLFNANYAIAISGVAGPNGGTINKPVGRVVIGICSSLNNKKEIVEYNFKGSRKEIQIQASKTSLKNLLNLVKKDLTI